MTDNPQTTEDDGCCGGGVGSVPYPLCTDCPRAAPVTTAPAWDREIEIRRMQETAERLEATMDNRSPFQRGVDVGLEMAAKMHDEHAVQYKAVGLLLEENNHIAWAHRIRERKMA